MLGHHSVGFTLSRYGSPEVHSDVTLADRMIQKKEPAAPDATKTRLVRRAGDNPLIPGAILERATGLEPATFGLGRRFERKMVPLEDIDFRGLRFSNQHVTAKQIALSVLLDTPQYSSKQPQKQPHLTESNPTSEPLFLNFLPLRQSYTGRLVRLSKSLNLIRYCIPVFQQDTGPTPFPIWGNNHESLNPRRRGSSQRPASSHRLCVDKPVSL